MAAAPGAIEERKERNEKERHAIVSIFSSAYRIRPSTTLDYEDSLT
jgi:hypothetical protein